jgi:hypothetical protein
MAWASIACDTRLQGQITQAQSADVRDKAKSHREAAAKAVRTAWSHILYPVPADVPGSPFALEHSQVTAREREAIPTVVYDKVKADGIALEKLGSESLWLKLQPIWADDRPHLPIAEVEQWFASFVYLPRLRDRVVLEQAMRDTLGKLDAPFAYADGFDEASGRYTNLMWAKTPPEMIGRGAMLVREDAARAQLGAADEGSGERGQTGEGRVREERGRGPEADRPVSRVTRFYGSVELDPVRPIKAFEAVVEAVVLQLQHSPGTKVKLTLDIEVTCESGFSEGDVGVVRDNARQLKFSSGSTGFEE